MTDRELMQQALDLLDDINQCSLPPTGIPLPAEIDHVIEALRARLAQPEPKKLWLWKNFVDGRPEYWAFDNPYPRNLNDGDQQTIGQPCGYAIFKPSRDGSNGRTEEQVLREMASVKSKAQPEPEPVAWHEPGAYSNVTVYKKWAEENGWLPLYKERT